MYPFIDKISVKRPSSPFRDENVCFGDRIVFCFVLDLCRKIFSVSKCVFWFWSFSFQSFFWDRNAFFWIVTKNSVMTKISLSWQKGLSWDRSISYVSVMSLMWPDCLFCNRNVSFVAGISLSRPKGLSCGRNFSAENEVSLSILRFFPLRPKSLSLGGPQKVSSQNALA